MADVDFSRDTADERLLLIAFENEEPLTAKELASVLRAMNDDYRGIAGHDLVVARIEIGSTWLWLTDPYLTAVGIGGAIVAAAKVAKAVDELATYAGKLISALKAKPQAVAGHVLSDDAVDRTVTAMAKILDKTDRTIYIKQTRITNAGVETLEARVGPEETKEARKRVRARPKISVETPMHEKGETFQSLPELRRSLPQDDGQFDAVLTIVIKLLEGTGSIYLLQQLAVELEAEGEWAKAQIVRRHLKGGDGHVTVNA